MKAIDTNIVVRIVARDDLEQLEIAKTIVAEGDVLLLPTVLLEAEWVLRARYGLPRAQIAEGLAAICGQEGVVTASANAVASALTAYAGAGDFADLLHVAIAKELGADTFTTFDRKFPQPKDVGLSVLIV